MTTSFIINIEDLNRILISIKIAEEHAAGGNLVDIINAAAGGNAAAIVPLGLRTVDGSFNHLLVGDTLAGAADQLFPRLLDPVYRTTSGTFTLNGTPVIVGNNNYDPSNPEGPGANIATSKFSVVDAAPRLISNLIVDQTFDNRAAVITALAEAGSENPTADADALIAARNAALAEEAPSYLNFDLVLTAAVKAAVDEALAKLSALADGLLADGTFDSGNPGDDADNASLAQAAVDAAVLAAAELLTALTNAGAPAGDILDATQLQNDLSALSTGISNAVLNAGTGSLLLSEYSAVVAVRNTAQSLAETVDANKAAVAFANLLEQGGVRISSDNSIAIPNHSADIGLSPPNSGWMTLFGQFFDHGLDLVTKGSNGTVFVPLLPDDQLYDFGADGVVSSDDGFGKDGIFGTTDDRPNFMALTRATMFDSSGNPIAGGTEAQNTTTPFVDQNQTYTSNASHQVFLREYTTVDGATVSTGHLLNNENGGIGTWADVKDSALTYLGLKLTDMDVLDVPLVLADPYGKFLPGDGGFAQVRFDVYYRYETTPPPGSPPGTPNTVKYFLIDNSTFDRSGTATGIDLRDADVNPGFVSTDPPPGFIPPANMVAGSGEFIANAQRTGHAFLNDIAHDAAPAAGLVADNDGVAGGSLDGQVPGTYDGELLDKHFITGDGRGNENIGLTAVHFIFHAEHDRAVEADKHTIFDSGLASTINDWLLPSHQITQADIDAATTPSELTALFDSLVWNGERLFQAARFTTEMQYQHMVFEEFARRIQPNVDPFVFTNSADIDPSIVAEFAHVVYRFGHSMLTDSVDRLQNDLTTVNGDADQIRLVEAFLNPQAFTNSGDGVLSSTSDFDAATNIIRGMSQQVGNEIDEFVVDALRNFLVGLPLDLPALNIARGRDTGIPGLNDARAQLYAASGHVDVKPYTSWLDFGQHMKHPVSLVNFIAAYGTHSTITNATTIDEKRDAAMELVFGIDVNGDNTVPSATDRLDFLNGRGNYAGGSLGGLNDVDLWIGGLAEEINEFGGQLGSTFNFVFEYQLEQLQNGDRFYYLSRTQGMNLLNLLEANTFADIIMRNTNLSDLHATHLSAEIMEVPDMFLELDELVTQHNYSGIAANDVLTTSTNLADRTALDPTHDDPFLQAIDRKVVRVLNGVDADGVAYDVNRDGVIDATDAELNMLKFSGGEHVVLGGTEGRDYIYGDKGIDTLWGDGGNDYLNAGMESDQVFGGDGDDIIEDPFGDDFLRGEAGDDVIVSSAGIDVLFGGIGNDFVQIVTDPSEVFAGPGDDFILGGSAPDVLLGNEGDDWIEGGDGFDGLAGENSELFFDSPIVGHDILWGQANDTDYDGENGDDIMVQGAGIQRNNGMEGFDWAIHKGDTKADGTATDAVSDMTNLLGVGAVNPAFILRDRFDSVEGLSGWDGNDTLLGASLLVVAGGGFDSKLTQEGVNRIDGLKNVIGSAGLQPDSLGGVGADPRLANALDTVILTSNHAFDGGEIILGGAGSDTVMGALGDDILDGDAWLNVRISVHADKVPVGVNNQDIVGNPEIFTVNSLTETVSGTGNADWDGKSLAELMRTGVINPGQLKAVREILNSDGSKVSVTGETTNDGEIVAGTFVGDVDTASFRYGIEEYIIEGNDDDNDGLIRGLEIRDTDNDGFIRVEHVPVGQGGGALRNADGIDHIRNFEVLEFADSTQIIQQGLTNNPATGTLNLQISTNGPFHAAAGGLAVGDTLTVSLTDPDGPGGPLTAVADADGLPPISEFTFIWQQSVTDDTGAILGWEDIVDPVTEEPITGQSFTPTAAFLLDGLSLRVIGRFTDGHGIREVVTSIVQGPLTGSGPFGPDPAAVLGITTPADPFPADGTVVGALVDLTNTIDPAGNVVPQAVDANNVNIPTFGTFEDGGPLIITKDWLLANVTDIDTPNATLQVLNLALRVRPGDPDPGTLVNNNDGTWSYTPAADFNGGVVFTFDVSDGTTATPLEAVLDVIPVNDAPPNPNALVGTTPAGIGATAVTFTLAQLFGSTPVDGGGRPLDIDGDRLTIDPATVTSPTGTVAFNVATGVFTWTPNAGAIPEALDVIINFQIDDGTGLVNAVTNATARIDAVNVAPTGSLIISDTTPAEGQVLTVNTATIADVNGLGPFTITWQASADFGAAVPVIANLGTGPSLTVPASAVGLSVRAVATFTDQGGTLESVIAAPTAAVVANATPTGAPVISEVITATNPVTVQITPTEGQQLSASALGIADADGITPPITFQWQSSTNGTSWTNIVGATNATFTPQDLAGSLLGAQAGLQLRVLANFVDGLGKPESVPSVPTAPVGANWAATPIAANTFNGTAGDDVAVGTNGIFGLFANDTLNGNAGNDRLSGAGGNDTLSGGADNDVLAGNAGNDTVNGGTGSDTIIWNTGDGRDLVDGGTTAISAGLDTSTDTFVVNGDGTAETFRIYTRAAFLAVVGNAAAPLNANTEIVVTRNGTNFASAIAELDNIEEIVVNGFDTTANNGDGVVNGGTAGGDTITVIGNFAPPSTSLNFSTITVNGSGNGDIVDISQLASEHRIVFDTGGGNGVIVGPLRPQDVVSGPVTYANVATNNADVFYGLNGKNGFAGLKGDDLYIIDGDDTIKEGRNGGTDEVRSWDSNLDLAKFANVENATLLGDQGVWAKGTAGANKLDGEQNSAANQLTGLRGNDVYVVGAGDTIVEARGGGTDTVSSHSMDLKLSNFANVENARLLGTGNLSIEGNDGKNVLVGNDGNNEMKGGKGNDSLDGGLGDDRMDGGAGNDIYNTTLGDDTIVIQAGFGNDRVIGFDADAAGGQDKIDISALEITAATFSDHVKIVDQGSHTLVRIDGGTLKLEGVRDHTGVTMDDFVLFAG